MVFEGVVSLAKYKVCSTSLETIRAAPAPQPDVAIDGTNLHQEGTEADGSRRSGGCRTRDR